MEKKKNHAADLERKRIINFQLGFIIALSLVLISLEWSSPVRESAFIAIKGEDFIDKDELPKLIPPDKEEKKVLPKVRFPVPVNDNIDVEDITGDIFNREVPETGIDISQLDEGPEEVIQEAYESYMVEKMAEFPGGEKAMLKWISGQLEYPPDCVSNHVEGRVTAKFVIGIDGYVSRIEIVRGVHKDLDNEVIRVLKLMPKFKPAVQNGYYVPVIMYWPIIFELH